MTSAPGSLVLDASAVIALLRDEPGAEQVEALLDTSDDPAAVAWLSTVNLTEVHQALGPRLPDGLIGPVDSDVVIHVADFTSVHAREAAALRQPTRNLGLSLGDRACLALAKALSLPAITADRAWAQAAVDVDVRLIR